MLRHATSCTNHIAATNMKDLQSLFMIGLRTPVLLLDLRSWQLQPQLRFAQKGCKYTTLDILLQHSTIGLAGWPLFPTKLRVAFLRSGLKRIVGWRCCGKILSPAFLDHPITTITDQPNSAELPDARTLGRDYSTCCSSGFSVSFNATDCSGTKSNRKKVHYAILNQWRPELASVLRQARCRPWGFQKRRRVVGPKLRTPPCHQLQISSRSRAACLLEHAYASPCRLFIRAQIF